MTEWRPEGLLLTDEELRQSAYEYYSLKWNPEIAKEMTDKITWGFTHIALEKQLTKVLNSPTKLGTVSEVLQGIAEGKIVRLADDQELPELNAAYLLASGVSYPYEMVWDSRGYVHPWIMQFLKKQRDLISEAGYMKVVKE